MGPTRTPNTRYLAHAGVLAALYATAVIALAPLSFLALQLRLANTLKALAICRPEFAIAFAVGNTIANQSSPFGPLDWAIMPAFDFIAARIAWQLRSAPPLAIAAQALIIAAAVATFPLGIGARLPWLISFVSVFASTAAVITAGHVVLVPVWRRIDQDPR